MESTICDLCKNPFYADANQRICLNCEELRFDAVKEYIDSHEDVSFIELIEETGVSKKSIDKWLMEGRLTAKGNELKTYINERREAIKKLAQGYQNSTEITNVDSENANRISFHTKK